MKPQSSDWLSIYRDHHLSATSHLQGTPGLPHEQWRVFLGGRIRVVETIPSLTTPAALDLLIIDRGGIHRVTNSGETVWRSQPAGYWLIVSVGDLAADGNTEIVATNGSDIDVLDGNNGECLWSYRMPPSAGVPPASIIAHAFNGARDIQLVVGIMYSTDLLIIDWKAGAHAGHVRTLHTDDMYHPALFIADMDHDGEDEIVVTKLCGIYQFSPTTLALKKSYTWLSDGRRLRNYGLFQAVDVNNDGRLEVVILASLVARHLAVVGNDGQGNLSVWWDRYIEMIYPTDTTEVRWVMNSVADVNGDGRPEIAISLYNTRGDGRWWTEVLDPLDGRLLAELPDSYLWDVRDIDGDGRAEILVSNGAQRSVPPRGQLRVYRYASSAALMQLLWQDADARFATRFHLNTPGLTAFRTDLVNDGEVWPAPAAQDHGFLIWKRTAGRTHLMTVSSHNGGQQVLAELPDSADGLDAAPELLGIRDLDADGQSELIISTLLGELQIAKAATPGAIRIPTGHSQGARLGGSGSPFVPAVWCGSDGRARIAVHDMFDRLRLYSINPARPAAPELLAALPGVGQSLVDSIRVAVYAADVNGDGQPEVLCVRLRQEGGSTLVAIDENGSTVRQWEFAGVQPGSAETRLGLYAWGVFDNVLITSWYQSLSMNTESSSAFDLRSGEQLWHIPHVFDGEDRRGFGPWSGAFTRQDGSVLFLAKDIVCHIDIRSGEWLHPPYMLRQYTDAAAARSPVSGMMDGFTAYGNIALHDVNDDDLPEYVVLACHGGFGVIGRDHRPIWWRVSIASDQVYRQGAIGDFDGDGHIEILISHSDGVARCYDGATGGLRWELSIDTRLADMAVCDIDGDGLVEAIGGGLDGRLYAIGNRQCDWAVDLGCSLGSVVIADLNGNARPDLLVAGADGYLRCLSL
jgi:outer membrane protein assembly factor BamB